MGNFTIRQGAHYHSVPPISTLPWVGSGFMVRYVTFDASCAYEVDAYHALDVNKLFGLSFGFGGVHHNSARFGWRYDAELGCIELVAYCYVNGMLNRDAQLNFPVVARVPLGHEVRCAILVTNDQTKGPVYGFSVVSTSKMGEPAGVATVARPDAVAPFGLTHGCYFGGDLVAPHDMHIAIDRL